jgi:hypothetical protein
VSIQESKAFTVSIEAGRRSRGRRHITSGPLVAGPPEGAKYRDLPQARNRPSSKHGFKAFESKEGN